MKVKVRKVSSKGAAALIEWDEDGEVQRTKFPATLLTEEKGEFFVDNPHEGAPYGEDWESLIPKLDPQKIASLLRQAGVWTYEDFLMNTPVVNNVFRGACGESYQDFVQAVHSRQSVQRKDE